MRRYFLISYQLKLNNGGSGTGSIEIVVNNGDYLNRLELIEKIKKDDKLGIKTVVILYITEIAESDFKVWNS